MAPLLLAVKEGHWAVSERLLQSHAPLEQCDSVGRSALMLAASEGHVGLIELLLDKGEYVASVRNTHSTTQKAAL